MTQFTKSVLTFQHRNDAQMCRRCRVMRHRCLCTRVSVGQGRLHALLVSNQLALRVNER
jgi:DTW domain-containing protein YfiP